MKQQANIIERRLSEIELQQTDLLRENLVWEKFKYVLGSHQHFLKDDDVLSARTLFKFELLARIVTFLKQGDAYMYGGAGTKEIYDSILSLLASERQDAVRLDVERHEAEIFRHPSPIKTLSEELTPMALESEALNYNTFRSHLARFRKENRIFYNPETRRWRVTEKEQTTGEAHNEEDDERERYAD